MADDQLLMIFVKNPIKGYVKTRLAKTIGEEKALLIYKLMLKHTLSITCNLPLDKVVFYSNYVNPNDLWKTAGYMQIQQNGEDLGSKMQNAFERTFLMGYKSVVIIGSDCLELSEKIIRQAFEALQKSDVVIGPAKDGGYYLLGMKNLQQSFFKNKKWSTENVFLDTMLDIQQLNLTYELLPTLSDVDEEKDLNGLKTFIEKNL